MVLSNSKTKLSLDTVFGTVLNEGVGNIGVNAPAPDFIGVGQIVEENR